MKDFLLSYDTVCLRPKFSTLKSRSEANISTELGGRSFNLPVVPANMADVIGINNARWLSENNYFYIYHRFGVGDESTLGFLEIANRENWKLISISVGINGNTIDDLKFIKENETRLRVDFITIDIAHAHYEGVKPIIKLIKEYFPKTNLIVGNVATKEGAEYLYDQGVEIIKVGIGGGSICTTRYKTGFHLPTLESVREASEFLKTKPKQVKIIADSGAKYYGDVAKALTLGASMVMSGGWFASCIDSPAKIIDGKKIYRGSTSLESKKENKHIEGRTLALDGGTTYAERMEEISQALRSSVSYAGGGDLSAFNSVEWARILP
jgi:GMP reductase